MRVECESCGKKYSPSKDSGIKIFRCDRCISSGHFDEETMCKHLDDYYLHTKLLTNKIISLSNILSELSSYLFSLNIDILNEKDFDTKIKLQYSYSNTIEKQKRLMSEINMWITWQDTEHVIDIKKWRDKQNEIMFNKGKVIK